MSLNFGGHLVEFTPTTVHKSVIDFDEACQRGLQLLLRKPNIRVLVSGYLISAFIVNVFLISSFALGA